jgi:hypothetical protein
MSLVENNKLLAEFLGRKYKDNYVVVSTSHICGENPSGEVWAECIFHRDWNWLMEVVEKCFKTDGDYSLHKEIEDALIFNSENRIQDVYNACVKFVKWYNKNK